MPLGTLDSTPPPFFRQGPSALSKLTFFSALALFLMVADVRLHVTQPLRASLASVLYPVQWLALRPVLWTQSGEKYFASLQAAQSGEEVALSRLGLQSQRAHQVEQLVLENSRLRLLLGLLSAQALLRCLHVFELLADLGQARLQFIQSVIERLNLARKLVGL